MRDADTVSKKGFFQNDRMLVCSMLVFYGICFLGLMGALFWGVNRQNQIASANATATGAVIATQNANFTATAAARLEEQDQYEFIERFNAVSGRWLTGAVDSEYWVGKRTIQDETYLWEVEKVKKTFISWADFFKSDSIEDFDVYVDTKILDASPGDVCSGLPFRISPDGWDEGGYYYALCNNAVAVISYYSEKDGWERIETVPYLLGYSQDWNRLEIQARGSHFSFLINGGQIFEIDDDRQAQGGLALVIELNDKVPTTVVFDNFGFQSR
jgi:hypothetical protein